MRWYLWIFLVLLPTVASASAIDSLNRVINGVAADSEKVKACIALAGEHLENDPAKAEADCRLALEIAKRSQYLTGIGTATGWMAYLKEQRGQIQAALGFYEESLDITRKLKEPKSEAVVLNNIAAIYKDQGKIEEALKYNYQSLKIREQIQDTAGLATSYNNIGLIQFNQGRIPESLENYLKALKYQEALHDYDGISTTLLNIAGVYKDQKEYEKAFEYTRKSLDINKTASNKYNLGYDYNTLGGLFEETGNLDSALACYLKSLAIRLEIDDQQGQAYSLKNIGIAYSKLGNIDSAETTLLAAIKLFEPLGEKWGLAISTNQLGALYLKDQRLKEAEPLLKKSYTLATELGYPADIRNAAGNLQQLYRQLKNWNEALKYNDVFIRMRDSVLNDQSRKAAMKAQFQYEYNQREAQLRAVQDKKDALSKAEISKQKIVRNYFIAGFVVVALFAGVFLRQRNHISRERNHSENLLLNILPSETATELKQKGKAAAREFDKVTVMFTDFCNFTNTAEKLSAQELVNEIHFCYSNFDHIITKYGIEKIKTIGDSYMCVGGLPVSNSTHAHDVVKAALEIRDFMQQEMTKRKAEGKTFFEIRIGCHTGPVVAGIVGVKKFAYDIWGDTVNTASRMESSGEAGKVNISATTYELVHNDFKCEARGKIEAKNKGAVEMYFVEA